MNSGGLIEAWRVASVAESLFPVFPPVNSGGLIEAQLSAIEIAEVMRTFPPVNSGGLIEAAARASVLPLLLPVSAGEFRRPH